MVTDRHGVTGRDIVDLIAGERNPRALVQLARICGPTVLVGHSTGGGEVARYIGRHGTSRVAKALLLSAIPPLMLKDRR